MRLMLVNMPKTSTQPQSNLNRIREVYHLSVLKNATKRWLIFINTI
jgi:hypothetical protein